MSSLPLTPRLRAALRTAIITGAIALIAACSSMPTGPSSPAKPHFDGDTAGRGGLINPNG